MAISFAPLTTSVDSRRPGSRFAVADEATVKSLRAELARRGVSSSAQSAFDTEQQKAVAAAFGPLEPSPSRKMFGLDDPVRIIQREVFAARDDTPRRRPISAARIPGLACHLRYLLPANPRCRDAAARALSPAGGDTCWANMAADVRNRSRRRCRTGWRG